MPDKYTEVKKVGLGNRLADSIKGVLVGILLFLVSFGVLYWNEGRRVQAANLLEQAKQAVEVNADTPDQTTQGKLVAAKGKLTSGDKLFDSFMVPGSIEEVFVGTGNYIKLVRLVEMYAWKENEETETTKSVGGDETQETTYTYEKDWTSDPKNSSNFRIPEDHFNPAMPLSADEQYVETAAVGSLSVDAKSMELPPSEQMVLGVETVNYPADLVQISSDKNYLFSGAGTLTDPEVGDIRVSYTVVPADLSVIAFGKLDGAALSNFVDEKNGSLYRAFVGTKAEAIAIMQKENALMTWILRIGGFLAMWFGLTLLFKPVNTFLDILPAAGAISRVLVGIVTFGVALVLSLVTIIVSMILHNIIAVIIAAAIALAAAVFVVKGIMKKRGAMPVSPQ